VIKNEPAIFQNKNGFKMVSFDNFLPIYYKWGTMAMKTIPVSWKPGLVQYYGGDPKWSIQKNELGLISIKRNPFEKGDIDGLFLKETFTQAYHFKGIINLDAENGMFEFVAKKPIDVSRPVYIDTLQNEKLNTASGNTLGIFNTDVTCELEFQIFIWPKGDRWNSICLFTDKADGSKNSGAFNWLTFTKQEFSLGFYSTGKAEVRNFEYRPLDSSWNPLNEPYIIAILKDLPKDFLPTPK
jgi:hypothetical protein